MAEGKDDVWLDMLRSICLLASAVVRHGFVYHRSRVRVEDVEGGNAMNAEAWLSTTSLDSIKLRLDPDGPVEARQEAVSWTLGRIGHAWKSLAVRVILRPSTSYSPQSARLNVFFYKCPPHTTNTINPGTRKMSINGKYEANRSSRQRSLLTKLAD